MKHFRVHLHVDDLPGSVAFYTKLFAAEPARVESDYAKWMLDEPRINFAISTRGTPRAEDHGQRQRARRHVIRRRGPQSRRRQR